MSRTDAQTDSLAESEEVEVVEQGRAEDPVQESGHQGQREGRGSIPGRNVAGGEVARIGSGTVATRASGLEGSLKTPLGWLVGTRIEILWPRDRRWFPAMVAMYDESADCYRVDYDDGEVEVVSLAEEKWRVENESKTQKRLKAHKRLPSQINAQIRIQQRSQEKVEQLGGDPGGNSGRRDSSNTDPYPSESPAVLSKLGASSGGGRFSGSTPGAAEASSNVPPPTDPVPSDKDRTSVEQRQTESMKNTPGRKEKVSSSKRRKRSSTSPVPPVKRPVTEADPPDIQEGKDEVVEIQAKVSERVNRDIDFLKGEFLELRESIALDQRKSADDMKNFQEKLQDLDTRVEEKLHLAKKTFEDAAKLLADTESRDQEQNRQFRGYILELEKFKSQAVADRKARDEMKGLCDMQQAEIEALRQSDALMRKSMNDEIACLKEEIKHLQILRSEVPTTKPLVGSSKFGSREVGHDDGAAASDSASIQRALQFPVGSSEDVRKSVIGVIALCVNVWLMENPHEIDVGEDVRLWSSTTTTRCLKGVIEYLRRYESIELAQIAFDTVTKKLGVHEILWLTRNNQDFSFERVRENYHCWTPPPTDEEWEFEKILLFELRIKLQSLQLNLRLVRTAPVLRQAIDALNDAIRTPHRKTDQDKLKRLIPKGRR